eukprot:sb/3473799/
MQLQGVPCHESIHLPSLFLFLSLSPSLSLPLFPSLQRTQSFSLSFSKWIQNSYNSSCSPRPQQLTTSLVHGVLKGNSHIKHRRERYTDTIPISCNNHPKPDLFHKTVQYVSLSTSVRWYPALSPCHSPAPTQRWERRGSYCWPGRY